MAVITPQTNIKLIKCPIALDSTNQLTFSSATAQYNYFNSLPKLEFDNCTYQRKDNYMAINEDADTLQEYNYCMYQNEQYGNKWFYAFITDITYQGNEVSYVTIKTDVYQTWLFECNFKPSFIEREHTNNDTIGANTIEEDLELGEYINCTTPYQSTTGTSSYVVAGVTEIVWLPSGTLNSHSLYNGVVGGLIYIILKDMTSFDLFINEYTNASKIDAIQCVFMIPTEFQPNPTWLTIPNSSGEYSYISDTTGAYILDMINVNVPSTIGNNYSPVNNKLLCYPYRYLLASNNVGTDVVYRYEDFEYFNQSPTGLCNFYVTGAITPSCSIKISPRDYKGITGTNFEEGFMMGKYPIGSWINDIYINWLTQNGINISSNLLINLGQIVGGSMLLGTGAGTIVGATGMITGLKAINDSVSEIRKAYLTPPQAEGNLNSGDVMFSLNKLAPTFYHMSIKNEYARVIDNFFSKFGYKTNRVKMPNLTGRRNWNYIKTIDANIVGNIPQKDLEEIKGLFNRGITLWHNPSTYLDYSQTNPII